MSQCLIDRKTLVIISLGTAIGLYFSILFKTSSSNWSWNPVAYLHNSVREEDFDIHHVE